MANAFQVAALFDTASRANALNGMSPEAQAETRQKLIAFSKINARFERLMRRGFGGDLADLLDEMTGYPEEDDPRWALRELGLDLALDDITTIMSALSVDPDVVAPVAPMPVPATDRLRRAAGRAPRELVRPWSFLSCPMRRRLRLRVWRGVRFPARSGQPPGGAWSSGHVCRFPCRRRFQR